MPIYAGKDATVKVGSTSYKFDQFTLEMLCGVVKTSNYTDSGYDTNIAGNFSAKASISGPYETGAMLFVPGTTYAFIFTVGGSVTFTITMRVSSARIVSKYDSTEPARAELAAESTGSFTVGLI